ncbi:MAG: DUF3786 domain-containing protein [Firmicutes bacterium]|nr:DUF3786 domain-containing protein [Bacillota bacterium]
MNKKIEDRQGRVPYEYIKNIFKDKNPRDMAKFTNTEFNTCSNEIHFEFMNKDFYVKWPLGEVYFSDGSLVKSFAFKTLILRYLVNSKGIPPSGKDLTYKEIPGGHVYYSNFYNRTIKKLSKLFESNAEGIIGTLKKMDAKKVNTGDIGFKFKFLEQIYITLIFWRGDDELSPSSNILFDANTPYYFDAEDLAVLGEIILYVLKNKGELPNWKGLYKDI